MSSDKQKLHAYLEMYGRCQEESDLSVGDMVKLVPRSNIWPKDADSGNFIYWSFPYRGRVETLVQRHTNQVFKIKQIKPRYGFRLEGFDAEWVPYDVLVKVEEVATRSIKEIEIGKGSFSYDQIKQLHEYHVYMKNR